MLDSDTSRNLKMNNRTVVMVESFVDFVLPHLH